MDDTNGDPATPALQRNRPLMESRVGRLITSVACAALLVGTAPAPLFAQPAPPPQQDNNQQGYSAEQLDALLAPIALYPDQLLTQILMASAYPDQVTAASQWVSNQANAQLRGDALTAALTPIQWDPSVKSLIPFPQVLAMMSAQPDWMQQLGYAMSAQQPDVMASVQRLRQQAQAAGQLQTTQHQVVSTEQDAIVIQPAQPDVVYVPSYNPIDVYGAWPYPDYPPYYLPPPVGFYGPGYGGPGYGGAALVGGIAFGVGIAVGVGLWGGLYGWARPNWGGRNVNVNVNVYNRFSPNRPWYGHGNNWHPYRPLGRPAYGYRAPAAAFHPPGGYRYSPNPGGFHGRPAGFHAPAGGFHPAPGTRPPPFHAPAQVPGGARGPGAFHAPAANRAAPGQNGRPGANHVPAAARPAPGQIGHAGARPEAARPATPRGPGEAAHRAPPPHRTQAEARPQAARPAERPANFARPEGGRPEGGRPQMARPEAARPPGGFGGGARPAPAPRPAAAPRPAGGGGHPGGGDHKH